MTTELILLLSIYAAIMLGIFLGDLGPVATFKKAVPRLAAKVERDLTTGRGFHQTASGRGIRWEAPPRGGESVF